jgi:hypothetical protein
MLTEDWWLRPDGTVAEMGAHEHAEEALRYLLKLPETVSISRVRLFTGISDAEAKAARARGVAENVLAYLTRDTIDPRIWLIQKEGWIRINREKWNLWAFDDATLGAIRNGDYWRNQKRLDPYDMAVIDEVSTGKVFQVPVRALRHPGADAATIKAIALRRGEFSFADEPVQTAAPRLGRPGGYTDKAGDEKWRYARVGENPPRMTGAIPMTLGPAQWRLTNGEILRFTPQGKVEIHIDEEGAVDQGYDPAEVAELSVATNPAGRREKRPTEGARLMIGFNVGSTKTWTLDGVLRLAYWIRRQQVSQAFEQGYARPSATGGDLGLTFLVQKGVWQPVTDKTAYPEDGTSLIILNTIGEDPERFKLDMEQLGEELATRLKQQAVIVEHQVRGVVEETVEMLPR